MNQLLVQEYRGELVECEYEGHICGVSYSGAVRYQVGNPQLNTDARHQLVAEGKPERHLYHNCSGKHLGILAYCKAKG